jgi:hypothetical protein
MHIQIVLSTLHLEVVYNSHLEIAQISTYGELDLVDTDNPEELACRESIDEPSAEEGRDSTGKGDCHIQEESSIPRASVFNVDKIGGKTCRKYCA